MDDKKDPVIHPFLRKNQEGLVKAFFILGAWVACAASLENSVTPFVESLEKMENLSETKYAPAQRAEILRALERKDEAIRVMSYNILFHLDDAHRLEAHRWVHRYQKIVEVLDEMRPDVLGVQEMFQGQLDDLLTLISGDYDFYDGSYRDGEINAIFYRKDRFKWVDGTILHLPAADPNAMGWKSMCPTLIVARLEDLRTGKEIVFSNTHLTFSKIAVREAQVRVIAETLAPLVARSPVVFMGDLNAFPNRPDLSFLPALDGDFMERFLEEKTLLRDAKCKALLGHVGPIATFTNVPGGTEPFEGQGVLGVFLDHIFVSSHLTVLLHGVQPAQVDGQFPSDHMPLFIDLIVDSHLSKR